MQPFGEKPWQMGYCQLEIDQVACRMEARFASYRSQENDITHAVSRFRCCNRLWFLPDVPSYQRSFKSSVADGPKGWENPMRTLPHSDDLFLKFFDPW
jgi:hypothetical protein